MSDLNSYFIIINESKTTISQSYVRAYKKGTITTRLSLFFFVSLFLFVTFSDKDQAEIHFINIPSVWSLSGTSQKIQSTFLSPKALASAYQSIPDMNFAVILVEKQWFVRRWLTSNDKIMLNNGDLCASSPHVDIFVQCWFMNSHHDMVGPSLTIRTCGCPVAHVQNSILQWFPRSTPHRPVLGNHCKTSADKEITPGGH